MYRKKKDENARDKIVGFLICDTGVPEPQNRIIEVHDSFLFVTKMRKRF